MTTYKMILAYDGRAYAGWQRLKGKMTIQDRLEIALSRLMDEEVTIVGSGRTDAGVHALGQVASFQLTESPKPKELMADLNHVLPQDIRVLDVRRAEARFHARHHAKSKHYRYHMNDGILNPLMRHQVLALEEVLNLTAMQEACSHMIGQHDFTAFSNAKIGEKSAVKTIERIEIVRVGSDITIDFYGDGFLYHMLRKMVATLIAVGEGKLLPNAIPGIINSKDRKHIPGLAPAHGLMLVEVTY